MTRDEVARECERHGWELDESTELLGFWQVWARRRADSRGHAVLELVGRGPSPREAYLKACKREQVSPF